MCWKRVIPNSVCFFAIFGDKGFSNSRSYEGIFKTVSATVKHAKGYISTSSAVGCASVGFGYSNSLFFSNLLVLAIISLLMANMECLVSYVIKHLQKPVGLSTMHKGWYYGLCYSLWNW